MKVKIVFSLNQRRPKEKTNLGTSQNAASGDDETDGMVNSAQLNDLSAPLVIFNDKTMDKPLTLSDISRITQDAPDPLTKTESFINWYKSLLFHGALSGKDIRYILTTLMPSIKIETLIEECPSLSPDLDGPRAGKTELEKKYPWLSTQHKFTHLKELYTFLKQRTAQEKDVSQILNCKRKPNETMSEYINRLKKCWTEDAKLDISDEENAFCVFMFLNGLDEKTVYTLKVTAPELYSMAPSALMKKIREVEAIGLFNKTTKSPPTQ